MPTQRASGPQPAGADRTASRSTGEGARLHQETLILPELLEYLSLPAPLIERLIEAGALPASRRGGRWCFNRTQVDHWLDLGMPGWPAELLHAVASLRGRRAMSLTAALQRGHIALQVPGTSGADLVQGAVRSIEWPTGVDRALLLRRLLQREALSSTAVGDGLSVVHTYRVAPRLVHTNIVGFVRADHPVAFDGASDVRSDLIFVVAAGSQFAHLVLLARVHCMARLPQVGAMLRAARTATEVRDTVRESERYLFPPTVRPS